MTIENNTKIAIIYLLSVMSISIFAGFVDNDDCTGFPNVNVDAHILKIARLYYPDNCVDLPEGVARNEAWPKDIREAAKGLEIPEEQLKAFIRYVLKPWDEQAIPAPHKKLYEFELYADGKRELWHSEWKSYPPSWKKLLELPLERRIYTTIPVLYAFNRYRSSRDSGNDKYAIPAEILLKQMAEARKAGCRDTQGCELAFILDIPNFEYMASRLDWKICRYKRLLWAYGVNCHPSKPWRYINTMDTWCWQRFRGDRFYCGSEMNPLLWSLYLEREEELRKMCQADSVLRDLIVGIGLTNRNATFKKIAMEFARLSPINLPVLAIKQPFAEAQKLLTGKPEHAQLLDLLTLKQLVGPEKVAAIDTYIAKYPDYTPEDMTETSLALNTHAELHALAGAELLKLGHSHQALERWLKGCTPEDIGIVAEQIFSEDELVEFCRKFVPVGVNQEQIVESYQCAYNTKILYPNMLNADEINYTLRNLLARRLMRAERFDEAREWFTGDDTRYYSELFFQLKTSSEDIRHPRQNRLEATLSLAALIRFKGDILFGTFLEPDNVICHGNYPCRWGAFLKTVKPNKPKLPRYHYRWIAAKTYAQALELTDDRELKGFCLWMAGTLLKNRDPGLAERYCRKLYRIKRELVDAGTHWFRPLREVPAQYKQWFHQRYFIFGTERIAAWSPEPPPIEKVELPPHDGSAKSLLELGIKLYEKTIYRQSEEIKQSMYALSLAGDKGNADAYFRNGVILAAGLQRYEAAIAFYKKALALNPKSNLTKHELGRAYLELGLWPEGVALIREVADTENTDKKLLGFASFNMARFYAEGRCNVTVDRAKSQYYLDKAIAAGYEEAVIYRNETQSARPDGT